MAAAFAKNCLITLINIKINYLQKKYIKSTQLVLYMKPKDLKFPFSWEERQPLFQKGIFYVPHYYFSHRAEYFPSFASYFEEQRPVCIEYCSGNGDWVIDQCKRSDKNWICVEKRFDRVQKIYSKRENANLNNLLIVCGEALCFSKNYLKSNSLDGFYINFPDPWPKDKHAKHRLCQPEFVKELKRVLCGDAKGFWVTDDASLAEQIAGEMQKQFEPDFPKPFYSYECPSYGKSSWFETLWRSKERKIHYLQFSNREC